MSALCAFRPKTRVASGPTPAIWSPIQSGIKLGSHKQLGLPDSLKTSEHRFLLVVGHLIKHAHVGAYGLLGLAPAAIENCNRRSDLCGPGRLLDPSSLSRACPSLRE